jgi:hypothetical protein
MMAGALERRGRGRSDSEARSPSTLGSGAGARSDSGARSPGSSVRCGRCGRAYVESEWDGLAVVDRVEGRRLEELVTAWPHERTIEVRGCAGCGGALARTVTSRSTR